MCFLNYYVGILARYVYKHDIERFCHLGKVLFDISETGEDGAIKTINALEEFFYRLGLPICISQLTGKILDETELKYLPICAQITTAKTIGTFNPLNYEDVYTIFKMANH